MATIHDFGIPGLNRTASGQFFLIAGPCVVENRDIVLHTARELKRIAERLEIPLIFKSSYRKANRTRLDSFRGIGDRKALEILAEVRELTGIPIITDIHESAEAARAAEFADLLQIPAFLCRQTDLILAAAQTGKPVNLKKGQFLSPEAMRFGVQKIEEAGNRSVILTERGTTFGYGDLVVDFRSIPLMKRFGYPVVLDITHSLQQPNQSSGVSGGLPDLIGTIACAGVAAGVDGIFLETHPEPAKALSDGANMLALDQAEGLLTRLAKIHQATHAN